MLINVNYGPLLTSNILSIGSLLGAFKLPIQQLFNIPVWYETNSRGKLTWAEIDVLLVNNVPTLAVMYLVRVILI